MRSRAREPLLLLLTAESTRPDAMRRGAARYSTSLTRSSTRFSTRSPLDPPLPFAGSTLCGVYCHIPPATSNHSHLRGLLPPAWSTATRGVYHLPGLLPHHSNNQQPPTSAGPTATRGVYCHIPATTSTHHHSLKPSRTVARPLHHRDASFSPTLTVTVVLPMLQAVRCLSCGV